MAGKANFPEASAPPKEAGVKRRRSRKRHSRREKESSVSKNENVVGNRLEVSFLNPYTAAATSDDEPAEIPPAVPATLDCGAPASIASSDWKKLCQIWSVLATRQTGTKKAWSSPTPIQLQAWPILLEQASKNYKSSNLITLAPTGSGKTLAYGIPLVFGAMSLVLVPTRELSIQVAAELTAAARALSTSSDQAALQCRIVPCHGGVNKQQQVTAMLQRGESQGLVVAATPGRLLDLLQSKEESQKESYPTTTNRVPDSDQHLKLQSLFRTVEYVVFDEADRLAVSADLYQQVDQILSFCPDIRRTCLCSATWPDKAGSKWNEWLGATSPCVVVKVNSMILGHDTAKSVDTAAGAAAPDETTGTTENGATESAVTTETKAHHRTSGLMSQIPAHLTQTLHVCAEHKKPRKLVTTIQRIRKENPNPREQQLGIVFFSKIKTLQFISNLIAKDGIVCQELHSKMQQHERKRAVQQFQCGKQPLLLATDIAARGIHVDNIHFCINYDFPGNLEQYVHRCGRAGRGTDSTGAVVYSFFTRNMAPMAPDVVRLLEANQQWVDPNLRELAESTGSGDTEGDGKKKRRRKEKPKDKKEAAAPEKAGTKVATADDAMSSDAEAFPEISASRIVLKRSGNISDASADREGSDCETHK